MKRLLAPLALVLSACGGGGGGSDTNPSSEPAPIDAVGLFQAQGGYRFEPENVGFATAGPAISDGARILYASRFTYNGNTEGAVVDYVYSRSGDQTSGTLTLRRQGAVMSCSGTDTGTITDNDSIVVENFVFPYDGNHACRGAMNASSYKVDESEGDVTVAGIAGTYSSAAQPPGGAFDANGAGFTVQINGDGTITLTRTTDNCAAEGSIALVEDRKTVFRVSGVSAACASSPGTISGLAVIDGAALLIILTQADSAFWHYGSLVKTGP